MEIGATLQGTTAGLDKRHVVLPGGYIPDSLTAAMKEVVDWLDRYLGPVPR